MPSLPGSGSKMDPKRLEVRGREKELIPDGEEEEWNEAESAHMVWIVTEWLHCL